MQGRKKRFGDARGLESLENRLLLTAYMVDSLADTVADDGLLTLREAIQAANTNAAVCDAPAGSSSERDIISFNGNLIDVGPITISLSGAELTISDDLSIVYPGMDRLTIDAGGNSRVFFISGTGTEVSLIGLRLSHGEAGTSQSGGALFFNGSTVTLTDCIIDSSHAEYGGGIYVGNSGTLNLSGCVLEDNTASAGGALYVSYSTATLTGGRFESNTATIRGGAVYNYSGTLSATNTVFSGNEATLDGGALRLNDGTTRLTNCVINGNKAGNNGGGIALLGNGTTLVNSTIAGNTSDINGGGIYSVGWNSPTLNNTIVAFNHASADGDNVSGNWKGSHSLVDVDPGFVRNPTAGADGIWFTSDDDLGDLHLQADSLATNWGDSAQAVDGDGNALTTDLAGNARNADGVVDAGAYEYQGAAAAGKDAPSLIVTTLQDVVDAHDELISLREAIAYASPQAGSPATITFDSSLFDGGPGTILLNGSQLEVNKWMTIQGPASDLLTIDAGGQSRVIRAGISLKLKGVTITGGVTSDAGGGIYSTQGSLTLEDVVVIGNTSTLGGGGLYVVAVLDMTDSKTIGNTTLGDGGGIYAGNAIIHRSVVKGNSASSGGGIYLGQPQLWIDDSEISGNHATDSGGGIYIGPAVITAAGINILQCTISGNSADYAGGIYNYQAAVSMDNTILTLNWATNKRNISGLWSGRGNLVGRLPGFVRNPSAGADNIWGTADDDSGDLRLRALSLCIDRGLSSLSRDQGLDKDVEGNQRESGRAVDMGAYEYNNANFVMAGGHGSQTFRDADGTVVTISYTGPGTVAVTRLLTNDDHATWGDIQTITIDGSNATSRLAISVRGSGRTAMSGDLTVRGSIGSIRAGRTDLGMLTIDGSISNLSLGNVSGGTLAIGSPAQGDRPAVSNILLGRVSESNLTSQTAIRSLSAVEWLDADGVADVIEAPSLKSLTLRGGRSTSGRYDGDFEADVRLSGIPDSGLSLATFRAGGTVSGSHWALMGGVGSIVMGSSTNTWSASFGTTGAWADIDSIQTTKGDLSGYILARSIRFMKAYGKSIDAIITLNPS